MAAAQTQADISNYGFIPADFELDANGLLIRKAIEAHHEALMKAAFGEGTFNKVVPHIHALHVQNWVHPVTNQTFKLITVAKGQTDHVQYALDASGKLSHAVFKQDTMSALDAEKLLQGFFNSGKLDPNNPDLNTLNITGSSAFQANARTALQTALASMNTNGVTNGITAAPPPVNGIGIAPSAAPAPGPAPTPQPLSQAAAGTVPPPVASGFVRQRVSLGAPPTTPINMPRATTTATSSGTPLFGPLTAGTPLGSSSVTSPARLPSIRLPSVAAPDDSPRGRILASLTEWQTYLIKSRNPLMGIISGDVKARNQEIDKKLQIIEEILDSNYLLGRQAMPPDVARTYGSVADEIDVTSTPPYASPAYEPNFTKIARDLGIVTSSTTPAAILQASQRRAARPTY